ncbi:hypothetical protein COCNU_05G010630 [Cocos nucifera]|uniref:Uncharacterized protein n=1 Tax=Cocos nucifera TaxID=13894 RepID=A0A8K0IA51_COCNU|nr:hypothetical protein COCNU_05G010630 [Cocos nucifera]
MLAARCQAYQSSEELELADLSGNSWLSHFQQIARASSMCCYLLSQLDPIRSGSTNAGQVLVWPSPCPIKDFGAGFCRIDQIILVGQGWSKPWHSTIAVEWQSARKSRCVEEWNDINDI